MLPSERVWMFNNNTTNHRGVWHVLPERPPIIALPAETVRESERVYEYHAEGCRNYWDSTKSDRLYDCADDCPIKGENKWARTIGECYVDVAYPAGEQTAWSREDAPEAICGQVTFSSQGGRHKKYSYVRSREIGSVRQQQGWVEQVFLFTGPLPPGPFCSRCLRKAEKNGTE